MAVIEGYEQVPVEQLLEGDLLLADGIDGDWEVLRVTGLDVDCRFTGNPDHVSEPYQTFSYVPHQELHIKLRPLDNSYIINARLQLKELSDERNRNWQDSQVQYFSSRWLRTG